MPNPDFLPQKGGYRNLKAFKISEWIYDLTFVFCHKFLGKGDRTVDQMIQAARSGKQNIAEGSAAATTSKETEIKLTNVAKASLQELLLDYEDYLITRKLNRWQADSPALLQTREVLKQNPKREYLIAKSEEWSDQTFANVVITMIHQCDYLLQRLIEKQKQQFLTEGGIREAMTRARLQQRQNQNQINRTFQTYRTTQTAQTTRTMTQTSPSCPSCLSSPISPSFPSNPSSPSSPTTTNNRQLRK